MLGSSERHRPSLKPEQLSTRADVKDESRGGAAKALHDPAAGADQAHHLLKRAEPFCLETERGPLPPLATAQ